VLFYLLFDRKGTELNSSIFLTLIVAITVGQATYIVKEQSQAFPKIIFATIFVCLWYGNLCGNLQGRILMSDMPMVVVPLSSALK
jgi:NAD(P)H-quinone oxidoreductase subunit 5